MEDRVVHHNGHHKIMSGLCRISTSGRDADSSNPNGKTGIAASQTVIVGWMCHNLDKGMSTYLRHWFSASFLLWGMQGNLPAKKDTVTRDATQQGFGGMENLKVKRKPKYNVHILINYRKESYAVTEMFYESPKNLTFYNFISTTMGHKVTNYICWDGQTRPGCTPPVSASCIPTGPIQADSISSISQQAFTQGLENAHEGGLSYLEHRHQGGLSVFRQTVWFMGSRDRDISGGLAKLTAGCLPTAGTVMDDSAEHDSTILANTAQGSSILHGSTSLMGPPCLTEDHKSWNYGYGHWG